MTDTISKNKNFEIPSIGSVAAMLRSGSPKLKAVQEHNDRVWDSYENETGKVLAGMTFNIINEQAEIKKLEGKLKEHEAALYSYIKAHEPELKQAGMLSYDGYGNITLRLNKETLKNAYEWLGKDATISIFKNILPTDKEAQLNVIKILAENGINTDELLSYSNFKISDVLKKLNSSPLPHEKELFGKLSNLVRDSIVIRVSSKSKE